MLVASPIVRGDWADLHGQGQRYAAIASLLRGRSSVLDIGAGEGLLHGYLPAECAYLGLEPEREAVARAKAERPTASIRCVRVEDFIPDHPYDAIVFNESIYYLRDPVAVVQRAAGWLLPRGLMVFSVYQRPEAFSARVWLRWVTGRTAYTGNIHCEQIVRAAMASWPVVADERLCIGRVRYHVWAVVLDAAWPRLGGTL